ncbi:tRNA (guanosine(37)-N1)-methyltransferase TrmD [Campylobacter sp. 19-13652]|uniref:tRNA (guanosine(37)-N1)-methyltransferase TrmD n=1 Tax=Campylobacter sp. 19-13652 TaxID=2840180 RepID=UPI001C77219A|nr:tRNA (guanosine(37)-N1)-methyltransferase TrmD [Campylobacter sp. 19-13652]BCX79373.1 tRNA (guanine-N(1)-)-methyltransferase [Campylobacter sp. 19-13652]
MKFSFITLFPELILPYFQASILGRALKSDYIDVECINPRDYSQNRHKKVDEYMVGGGAGLLMTPEPLSASLENLFLKKPKPRVIFLTPVGKKFTQNDAKRLAKQNNHICFVCGRYEGIDERIIELYADEVFSIGDFILTGGELGSLCMADAISRNIMGVLGNSQSLDVESFEANLLEAPSFTKPDNFRGLCIVSEFLKGNHSKITALKSKMALCKTRFFRPDLYQKIKPQMKEIQ